jgi:TonB family protein
MLGMRAIPAVVSVAIAFIWSPSTSSAAEVQRPAPVLEFNLASPSETGLLDPGNAFEFSVRLKGFKPGRGDDVVAIFESLAYPHRLVSFSPDEASADLTAAARFEARPMAGADGQPLRMEVVVARLKGMRLETLFSRSVYLTTAPSVAAPSRARSASAPATSPLEALLDQASATDRFGQPVQPLLLPEDIREESLGGGSPAMQSPLYWETVRESVGRQWQRQLAQMRKSKAGKDLRVRFRLYPGGFAQLIQVERSSGDSNVDEAALRTVLGLHPFPPFPPDVREPSVDVHVDLPGSKR